ncbi:neuropeptide Y receptor [Tyrophagus putrescentiae]|nr:neuropeptide Y receptor [Tyrophagus putrescentiae]
MFTPTSITLALLFALFWLVALAAHLVLLKLLLVPYERVKLRLPAGSWPLLLTITIADLVALLTALPFTSLFAIFNHWFFGEAICDMSTFVKVASLTVSSYVILALLMQSYEMVVKTTRPKLSTVKLGLLVGSIWLLAVVTALPMLWSHSVVSVGTNERIEENLETFDFEDQSLNITKLPENYMSVVAKKETRKYCAPSYHLGFIFHSVMYIYLQFLIPLAIVFYLFIKITDTMNKQTAQGKNSKNNTMESAQQQQPDVVQMPQDLKFVRTILILTVVFHLSWAPANFFTMFIASNSVVSIYIDVLSELTFFIKPLLFFAFNTNFQNALRTIGVPTTDVEDVDGYQVGFSRMDETGLLLTSAERTKLRLPSKAWLFFLSITVADLAALVLGLPFTALFEIYDDWLFGSLLCRLVPFVKTVSVTVSAYGILALLMQSYEIACKSNSKTKKSSTKLNLLVGLNALFVLVTATPLLIAPTVKPYEGPDYEDLEMLMFEEAMIGVRQNQFNETLLVERALCYVPQEMEAIYPYCRFHELVILFAVPLIIVVYLFIKTADSIQQKTVEAKRVQRSRTELVNETEFAGQFPEQQQPQQQQQQQEISKNSLKFVKMILTLAVAYHLLRTPFILFEHFIVLPLKHANKLWYAFTVLSESTYFIKPVLLLAVNGNFRWTALRTLGSATTDDNPAVTDTHGALY